MHVIFRTVFIAFFHMPFFYEPALNEPWFFEIITEIWKIWKLSSYLLPILKVKRVWS